MIVSPRCTRRAAAPLTHISPEPRSPGDRVGLEARAVVDVDDVHLLVLEDVGRLEQVGVDRDRADVVQVAVGDRRPVDLRLEHHALHVAIAFPRRVGSSGARLGRRAWCCRSGARSPTRAAIASRASSLERARAARACRGRRARGTRARRSRRSSAVAGACAAAPRPSARRAPASSLGRAQRRGQRQSALRACTASSRALRLDIARPSGSRTVGSATISHGQVRGRRPGGGSRPPAGRPSGRSRRRRAAPCRAAS